MDEQRDVWVLDEIVRLLGCRVGRHDDDGRFRELRRGEVGIVHEGDMRHVVRARREMKLFAIINVSWDAHM